MCRIYGHVNAAVSRCELRGVAALQRHGGPDGHGSLVGDGYALGGNRLAVMDPGGGRQPYRLGDIHVVFNGEIYNHRELRARLRGRGYTFPDDCDGSVLPALYLEYGERFGEQLDGMFAVAVLDLRGEPRLILTTDPAGMKPVYYSWDAAAKVLRFSSEIGSLLAFPGVSTELWTPGLDAYLATRTPFGEQTMFADVKVLPPGAVATCGRGAGLRIARLAVPEGAGGELGDVLPEQVRNLLVADVPVATITSGGLDSSLVTAHAARARSGVHTFNIAYVGRWPGDERHFAREVAEHVGATYHQVELDPADFPGLLDDVVWHLGQPNADPITLSTFALFRAVREAGFTVALTGDAADEVFGGYDRMRDAVADEGAGRPWIQSYVDSLAVLPRERRRALYTDEYAYEVRDVSGLPEEAEEDLRSGGSALARITAFELAYRLPAYHLRRVDHLSMAHSIEARLPFCEPAILAVGRGLADSERVRDGQVKRALYAVADGLVPDAVLRRPKQPFTLPITAMLVPGQPLWGFARDVLGRADLRADGQVDPVAVEALFSAQADRPDARVALALWALVIHQVWRAQFRVRLPAAQDSELVA
ncbi:asparagine synthase (glutamine-hydrolyzing) [Actinokineospora enzanensis]|uniref:asparagine synthase (glutamine-hydrolyzing) n=1 Tax=Actinokineospora enzanensis TaxID=155975 RepID=UPI00035EE42B|nr:asparagine synthase (glutamine-hydrolyzing) [Actinokineospora enzanensis]